MEWHSLLLNISQKISFNHQSNNLVGVTNYLNCLCTKSNEVIAKTLSGSMLKLSNVYNVILHNFSSSNNCNC